MASRLFIPHFWPRESMGRRRWIRLRTYQSARRGRRHSGLRPEPLRLSRSGCSAPRAQAALSSWRSRRHRHSPRPRARRRCPAQSLSANLALSCRGLWCSRVRTTLNMIVSVRSERSPAVEPAFAAHWDSAPWAASSILLAGCRSSSPPLSPIVDSRPCGCRDPGQSQCDEHPT